VNYPRLPAWLLAAGLGLKLADVEDPRLAVWIGLCGAGVCALWTWQPPGAMVALRPTLTRFQAVMALATASELVQAVAAAGAWWYAAGCVFAAGAFGLTFAQSVRNNASAWRPMP